MSTAQGQDDSVPEPLLDVRGLGVEYDRGFGRPPLRALDDVGLSVDSGEAVGLVGESGSGKSTLGRVVLGLTRASRGRVVFQGEDITHARRRRRRELGAVLQAVFQDPYNSLNPTRIVGATLEESLWGHGRDSRSSANRTVADMLDRVGLPPETADRYPAQFSGGQRQRIAIARALVARPRLVVCDEPVSALDLSVQAQVLNLLRQLQTEMGLGYLFIAHDLTVVRRFCRRVVVLYRGQVMEEGDAEAVCTQPKHPYTRALFASSPAPDPAVQRRRRQRAAEETPAPLPVEAASGCSFASRCPFAVEVCFERRPEPERADGDSVSLACHRWRELDPPRELLSGR